MVFDRIILSSDENKMFLQFLILVTRAWKKFFPEVKTTMAFITERSSSDELVVRVSECVDDLNIFRPMDGVPLANQAKVSRHVMAGYYPHDLCVCHDIDSLPLQRLYHEKLISQHIKDTLMAVGREVYDNTEHEGKFPSGHMCAEGHVFKRLFNPHNLSYEDVLRSWMHMRTFDCKEDILAKPSIFSDESLIRSVISQSKDVVVHYVKRGVNIRKQWVDRSWWKIDQERLINGYYTECNLLRPFDANFERIQPIVNYICGSNLTREEIILR